MRRMIVFAIMAMAGVTTSVFGQTYDVSTINPQVIGNHAIVSNRYTASGGPAQDVWVWTTMPGQTVAALDFNQTAISAEVTTSPSYPMYGPYDFGAWIEVGDNFFQETLTTTLNTQVSVTINLTGLTSDVPAGASGEWARATARAQFDIPGLAALVSNLASSGV